jgi:hypothetical protein
MATVPEHELAALRNLTGYDQMLEIDRLCKTYGTDEATIRASLQAASTAPTPTNNQPTTSWDTSHKNVPGLGQATAPTVPTFVDKKQFQFEYDPTREAEERREQVSQAILCAACGVALGIPDIRPIKVTCPACLFETTYTD